MSVFLKSVKSSHAAIGLMLLLGFFLQYKYLNTFPTFTHAWAQSDHYALAQGFVSNGLNFFEPETKVYNHQFPDEWASPSEARITAVGFPIHDFIPGLMMTVTGSKAPGVFRMYILLYSFIGLFFLFRWSLLMTRDSFKALLVLIFAASAPVFVYYQGGFLPTIPSLSNVFIAFYFYFKHLENNRKKDFIVSILFLTLAALSRTTFAIPLIAVLAAEFLRMLKSRSIPVYKILTGVLSACAILGYFLYNGYLRQRYGSIFLHHIMPPDNLNEAINILKQVQERWLFDYLSPLHYLLLALVLVASWFGGKNTSDGKPVLHLRTVASLTLLGCLMFSALMLKQFSAHDYYFLDTFFLPILLFLVYGLMKVPRIKSLSTPWMRTTLLIVILLPLSYFALQSQDARRVSNDWNRTAQTVENYEGVREFLHTFHVAQDAKLLICDGGAPNLPFLLADRYGFTVMTTSHENIQRALGWNFDFLLSQDAFFMTDLYNNYPPIIQEIEKVGSNGKLTLYKKKEDTDKIEKVRNFLELTDDKMLFQSRLSEDSLGFWLLAESSNEVEKPSITITAEQEYGPTFVHRAPHFLETPCSLLLELDVLPTAKKNCNFVVSVRGDNQTLYHKSIRLSSMEFVPGEWKHLVLTYPLPASTSASTELRFYIWNNERMVAEIDHLNLEIYPTP